jgi:hypothetical protein
MSTAFFQELAALGAVCAVADARLREHAGMKRVDSGEELEPGQMQVGSIETTIEFFASKRRRSHKKRHRKGPRTRWAGRSTKRLSLPRKRSDGMASPTRG